MIRFAIPDVRVSDPSHAHYVSIAHLICDLEVRPDLRHDFKLFFIRFCGPQLLKVFDVESGKTSDVSEISIRHAMDS